MSGVKNVRRGDEDALPHAFAERVREIERAKAVWRNWFLVNVFFLFGVTLFIFFWLLADVGFAAASWLEFGVALPLAYSAVFFHAQHNKAREYLEEYSFKLLTARSLYAYRKFLREDVSRAHPDEQKKYLDFLIGLLKGLSTPPREIISKNSLKDDEDVKVGVVEKLGDVFKKFIPGKVV